MRSAARTLLVALTVASMLLAGCLGSGPAAPDEGGPTGGGQDGGPTDGEGAGDGGAGGAGGNGSGGPAEEGPAPRTLNETYDRAHSGVVAAGFNQGASAANSNCLRSLDTAATDVLNGTVTLTWQAQSAMAEQLHFRWSSDDQGLVAEATGPSPLVVPVPPHNVSAGANLTLLAQLPDATAGAAVQQSFSVQVALSYASEEALAFDTNWSCTAN